MSDRLDGGSKFRKAGLKSRPYANKGTRVPRLSRYRPAPGTREEPNARPNALDLVDENAIVGHRLETTSSLAKTFMTGLLHRPWTSLKAFWSRESADGVCGTSEDSPDLMENTCDLANSRLRSLDELPVELLMQIMGSLSPSSLWALRQSSSIFLKIFDTKPFESHHGDPGFRDCHMPFSTNLLTSQAKIEIEQFIKRDDNLSTYAMDSYCALCTEKRLRGEDDPRMVHLRKTSYCTGCKERHANIFFSDESLERFRRGSNELVCIGRSGKVTLCSHQSHEPITWDNVENLANKEYSNQSVTCTLHKFQGHAGYGSPFPRLVLENGYDRTNVIFGWDLPMLDIDDKDTPSTNEIRRRLATLMDTALQNYRTCSHMQDGRRLRKFPHTGICACFGQPNIIRRPMAKQFMASKGTNGCKCVRQLFLDCPDCGAIFGWHLAAGRVTLLYRYVWTICKPTSPAWLNLLDEVRDESHILDEKYRHILWCDAEGCSTGNGKRWNELIKEEIWQEEERFGSSYDKPYHGYSDSLTMLLMHSETDATYKLP